MIADGGDLHALRLEHENQYDHRQPTLKDKVLQGMQDALSAESLTRLDTSLGAAHIRK